MRENSAGLRDYGENFEILTKKFLETEPRYKALYKNINLWGDWIKGDNLPPELQDKSRTDIGIDLVAEEISTGKLIAIQCKAYDPKKKSLRWEDVSSFLGLDWQSFSGKILVTTQELSTSLREALEGRGKDPVICITLVDFEKSVIDWAEYQRSHEIKRRSDKPVFNLKKYQETAFSHVIGGLKKADRGQLIMACGTGKTFTALRIAECQAGAGKTVLFCVPSLALLSQTLTEWTQQAKLPLYALAVCSDSSAGRLSKTDEDDAEEWKANELAFPATTKPDRLADALKHAPAGAMRVIFSTYHSIEVIADAQKKHNAPDIDLIICDEAHRTTGQGSAEGDKPFARIHRNDFIRADKRLYMTATPVIYKQAAREAAKEKNITLYGMNDKTLFGDVLYSISFAAAVQRGCLCDYKLLVLAIDEAEVAATLQEFLRSHESGGIAASDAARILGCWRALAKLGLAEEGAPMQRAIAFAQVIDKAANRKPKRGGKKSYDSGKVSSKQIRDDFPKVIEAYKKKAAGVNSAPLIVETRHVDGTMDANQREEALNFLRRAPAENHCHLLSNVRCLSEGVDVPALDAVLFLAAKQSPVEITQAVGRVMRTLKDKDGNHLKKLGYVILPVVIPEGKDALQTLKDSDVWRATADVVQALRSHDPAIDIFIDHADEYGEFHGKIEIVDTRGQLSVLSKAESTGAGKSGRHANDARRRETIGSRDDGGRPQQAELEFEPNELERGIVAMLVRKCGTRLYWPRWAEKIDNAAARVKGIIERMLKDDSGLYAEAKAAFENLLQALRDNISAAIDAKEALNILTAQSITKPLFAALFSANEHDFPANNAVARSLDKALRELAALNTDKEKAELEELYASIRNAVSYNAEPGKRPTAAEEESRDKMRQSQIKDIYQHTIKAVYGGKETATVVYTPIEAVDFILRSVNELLASEFGASFNDENITVLEPFAGTGSFITRLLAGRALPQNGEKQGARFISPAALPDFYANRLWLNENNLIAYYASVANIETTYHRETGHWKSFKNACFTDSFILNRAQGDMHDALLAENRENLKREEKAEINVIIGNPPYGSGATRAYKDGIDKRIGETYANEVFNSPKITSLYDGYIRAFRWATDRIKDKGIIAFITNGGFLDSAAAAGLRRDLQRDFSSLYIFNLRGNANTQGELRRKEGDGIFGEGSRAPAAISILVKNPKAESYGQIYYHDIGDYLKRDAKLEILEQNSVSTLNFTPWGADEYYDWLDKRDPIFSKFFIPIGAKKDKEVNAIFENYSNGVKTNKDAWAFNFSKEHLAYNMKHLIDFYNQCANDKNVIENSKQISWDDGLKNGCLKGKREKFENYNIISALYRPFMRSYLYYQRPLCWSLYQMPKVFPNLGEKCAQNLVIGASGIGGNNFSALVLNCVPELGITGASQCFPLYLYDEVESGKGQLALHEASSGGEGEVITDKDGRKLRKKSAITAEGLAHFRSFYLNANISAEDIFYYIYGLLHSPEYRANYKNNLKKEPPRIPRVKSYVDFCAFAEAGRRLADLHLNFDDFGGKSAKELAAQAGVSLNPFSENYAVFEEKDKIRHASKGDNQTIIYNPHITINNIPDEAYKYVINGRSAIDWVIERQRITTDPVSGITNNPNDYAREIGDPAYPLKLLLNVIHLSLETQKIVNSLPKPEIEDIKLDSIS